jgi:hypothetical protein
MCLLLHIQSPLLMLLCCSDVCKLSDDDTKMSKHVGVYITQIDSHDIHFYDINCVFVGYNKKTKITTDI